MNATETQLQTIRFTDLPAIGTELEGGEFAGIHSKPDGTHWAISKLTGFGSKLTHKLAIADAKERGGELPTKAIAALVVANLTVEPGWYWTCEVHKDDTSFAWGFNSTGYPDSSFRSAAGGALAVRLIQIVA